MISYDRMVVALVAALAFPATALAQTGPSVMVLNTQVVGLSPSTADLITNQVSAAVVKNGFAAMTTATLARVAEFQQKGAALRCESDEACLAKIAEVSEAELIMTSKVGKLGASFVVTLTLIDGDDYRVRGKIAETLSELGQLQTLMPSFVGQLLGVRAAPKRVQYRLPKGNVSFAVLELKPSGIEAGVSKNLTQVLSAEMSRIRGATVISWDDIKALLQRSRLQELLEEDCDTSCYAEIGGALGVDKLVVGNVGLLGDTHIVALRLIDLHKVAVENRVSESYAGPPDQLLRAVRHAGRRLVGLAPRDAGTLAVSGSEPEAQVFVDDREVGQLPLPPVPGLRAGRHSVRVSKDGYFDWSGDVYIDPGESTPVWTPLTERPEKWYQKWWVWTVAGTVVVGAATAAILLSRPGPAESDIILQ